MPESRQLCTIAGEPYRCGQQAALALADAYKTNRYILPFSASGAIIASAIARCARVMCRRWMLAEST